jgi:CheY-like chemotaxis protein
LQVIVFMDGARGLGLVVGEIVDIVEEAVHIRKQGSERGLLGSAVIGGQVTDFLDLRAVIEASGEKWMAGEERSPVATVLVAGASGFTRTLIRASIEMGGHRVVEAGSRVEAIERMTRQRIDVVALAPELENNVEQAGSGGSLIALLRKQAGREVPMLPFGTAAADHLHLTASLESLLAQV